MSDCSPTALAPRIRPAEPADLDRLMELELACFAYPWPREVFVLEIAAPEAHLDVLTLGPEGIVGFTNYAPLQGLLHLRNVAVDPSRRRQGLGTLLMDHVHRFAAAHGLARVLLEVRPSNLDAQRLYQGLGYRQVGVRRGYYQNNEDALVLVRDLPARR